MVLRLLYGLVIFVLVVLILVGVACNFVVLLRGLIVCGVCLWRLVMVCCLDG